MNIDIIRSITGKIQYGELVSKAKAEQCGVDDLLTNPYNRELDRSKVDKIKEDIKSSQRVYPLVYAEVDHDGNPSKMVVDGHHRYQALKELGFKSVPVVMQDERGIETKAPKENVEKTIRHEGGKWVLYSKDGSKKLGSYDSKEGALNRERQIQYFKHKS